MTACVTFSSDATKHPLALGRLPKMRCLDHSVCQDCAIADARASYREPTMKPVGTPDAGNPHVRFDERGGETGRANDTKPFLDSTGAKAHVVYDPDADCPLYLGFTPVRVNDITAARRCRSRPVQPMFRSRILRLRLVGEARRCGLPRRYAAEVQHAVAGHSNPAGSGRGKKHRLRPDRFSARAVGQKPP
jgi:hypothetical protein